MRILILCFISNPLFSGYIDWEEEPFYVIKNTNKDVAFSIETPKEIYNFKIKEYPVYTYFLYALNDPRPIEYYLEGEEECTAEDIESKLIIPVNKGASIKVFIYAQTNVKYPTVYYQKPEDLPVWAEKVLYDKEPPLLSFNGSFLIDTVIERPEEAIRYCYRNGEPDPLGLNSTIGNASASNEFHLYRATRLKKVYRVVKKADGSRNICVLYSQQNSSQIKKPITKYN